MSNLLTISGISIDHVFNSSLSYLGKFLNRPPYFSLACSNTSNDLANIFGFSIEAPVQSLRLVLEIKFPNILILFDLPDTNLLHTGNKLVAFWIGLENMI
jgi:hypothetical protein